LVSAVGYSVSQTFFSPTHLNFNVLVVRNEFSLLNKWITNFTSFSGSALRKKLNTADPLDSSYFYICLWSWRRNCWD